MAKINGKIAEIAGRTVAEIIEKQGFDRTRVAVELNGNIVPRAEYDKTVIMEDDAVEVVSFVGGG